jgi:hypothetical protein
LILSFVSLSVFSDASLEAALELLLFSWNSSSLIVSSTNPLNIISDDSSTYLGTLYQYI